MRTVAVCCGLFGFVLACPILRAQDVKTPREAAPVIAVLKAVKGSDVDGFKNAYSKQIREDKGQGNWEKNVKDAQVNLKKLFGDYQLNDFSFTFAVGSVKGK